MTALELLSAIGAADAADLEHSERRAPRTHRLRMGILMAAAVIVLLSTTVFGVPAIRNALFGLRTGQTYVSGLHVREGKPADPREGAMDVFLDVRMNPDAPKTIETCYVPLLPARAWDPIPLQVTAGQTPSFRRDTLLQWRSGDGSYVVFRQHAAPGYTVEQPLDSVSTGFDAAWTVDQLMLGGFWVQRITVAPSVLEAGGSRAQRPGLQKLYWSDGDYLFTMEVNYAMSEQTLGAILESIAPVERIDKYITVESVPAVVLPLPRLGLTRILFPASAPEGYTQSRGLQYTNGEYFFLWLQGETNPPSTLELSIAPQGRNDDIREDWELSAREYEKTAAQAGGMDVTCYQTDAAAQLLWHFDGADYTIKSTGPERLPVEDLLQILEGCVLTPDTSAGLMP